LWATTIQETRAAVVIVAGGGLTGDRRQSRVRRLQLADGEGDLDVTERIATITNEQRSNSRRVSLCPGTGVVTPDLRDDRLVYLRSSSLRSSTVPARNSRPTWGYSHVAAGADREKWSKIWSKVSRLAQPTRAKASDGRSGNAQVRATSSHHHQPARRPGNGLQPVGRRFESGQLH
jgi:hypothetical protein